MMKSALLAQSAVAPQNAKHAWKRQATSATLIIAAAVLSRLPFVSSSLYSLDSVQFALGLERFSIVERQPHPPGYILFMGLAGLLQRLLHDPNAALLFLAITFTAASSLLMYFTSQELGLDERRTWWAVLLWLSSPLVWFHGEVAETYTAGAFAALLSAYAALKFWRRPSARSAILMAGAFAFGAGLRPDQSAFMLPLGVYPFVISRPCRRFAVLAAAVYAAAYATWYLPVAASVGGIHAYSALVREAFFAAASTTSLLLGAPLRSYIVMVLKLALALVLGIGAGGLLLLRGSWRAPLQPTPKLATVGFLLCWGLPFLVFYAVLYFARFGYLLSCLPPLILLLAWWGPAWSVSSTARVALAGSAVVCLNAIFLFGGPAFMRLPLNRPGQAEYYLTDFHFLRDMDYLRTIYFSALAQYVGDHHEAIVFLAPPGDTNRGVHILDGSSTNFLDWRQLMYRFNTVPVVGVRYGSHDLLLDACIGHDRIEEETPGRGEKIAISRLTGVVTDKVVALIPIEQSQMSIPSAACEDRSDVIPPEFRLYQLLWCDLSVPLRIDSTQGSLYIEP